VRGGGGESRALRVLRGKERGSRKKKEDERPNGGSGTSHKVGLLILGSLEGGKGPVSSSIFRGE